MATLTSKAVSELPAANYVGLNDWFVISQGGASKKLSASVLLDGLNNWKLYSSVDQIGLTVGSATISEAFNALGSNTMLIARAEDFASTEYPNRLGAIEICKAPAGRSWIEFHGKAASIGDFRMFLDDDSSPNGVWTRQNYFQSIRQNYTVNCTEAADGGYIGSLQLSSESTFPSASTVYALALSARVSGKGYPCIADVGIASNVYTLRVYSPASGRCTVQILYLYLP